MKLGHWRVALNVALVVGFVVLIRFVREQNGAESCASACQSAIKPEYIVSVTPVNLHQPSGEPTHVEVIVRMNFERLSTVFTESVSTSNNWAKGFNVDPRASTTIMMQHGSKLCLIEACRGILKWKGGKLMRHESGSLTSILIPLDKG
jgi:hypothetical protein